MARARFIKPEFFKHGDLFDAEKESGLPLRLAFAGLWTQCDRAGRFAWKPRELKLDVLPYDDVDFVMVLNALERFGFIRSYLVAGKLYGVVPGLVAHQPFHKNEPQSKLPAPPVIDTPAASNKGPEPANDRPSRSTTTTDTVTVTTTEITSSPDGGDVKPDRPAPAIPAVVPPAPKKGAAARRMWPTADEAAVLEHYKRRHPKRRPDGDAKILLRLRSALTKYTVAELCRAIDGNADDEWHREKGKHDLLYVLRDSSMIDNFLAKKAAQDEDEIPILIKDPARAYALGIVP